MLNSPVEGFTYLCENRVLWFNGKTCFPCSEMFVGTNNLSFMENYNPSILITLKRHKKRLVPQTGVEPVSPPWKGGVLTTWLLRRVQFHNGVRLWLTVYNAARPIPYRRQYGAKRSYCGIFIFGEDFCNALLSRRDLDAGAGYRSRTHNLLSTKQLLYQLS